MSWKYVCWGHKAQDNTLSQWVVVTQALQETHFRLDIRTNFFLPSLEVFKRCVGVVLRDMVWWWTRQC